jgi:hypothetical protein
MVRLDTTGDPYLTVTGTETCASGWYGYATVWTETPRRDPETKEQKVTRLALEKNRKSWVSFNENKPRVKQFFKPRTNFNHRRR